MLQPIAGYYLSVLFETKFKLNIKQHIKINGYI